MINQNWWLTSVLDRRFPHCPPLDGDISCDVLIVGGGFSGVSAALELLGRGLDVVLIERNMLGGSSSGRSGGFLMPDSELELNQLVARFGVTQAGDIWNAPTSGIQRLIERIKHYHVRCELVAQDSLFLGVGRRGQDAVRAEGRAREQCGFDDHTIHDDASLRSVVGAAGYSGALGYPGTYGVNPLACVQGFKKVLLADGMRVFEKSELLKLEGHTAHTSGGRVTAGQIILAMDKVQRDVTPLADEIYQAQTFMSVSERLSDRQVARLFPGGRALQCWDSRTVYTYFRLTADQRLLVGGGTLISTFLRKAGDNPRIIGRVIRGFKRHFPWLEKLPFIQYWPGYIDTTRDFLPIIARVARRPYLQLILGVVGLPWAAFAGAYAARQAVGAPDEDDAKYARYFSGRRRFGVPANVAKVIGKPLLFSLATGLAKVHSRGRRQV